MFSAVNAFHAESSSMQDFSVSSSSIVVFFVFDLEGISYNELMTSLLIVPSCWS